MNIWIYYEFVVTVGELPFSLHNLWHMLFICFRISQHGTQTHTHKCISTYILCKRCYARLNMHFFHYFLFDSLFSVRYSVFYVVCVTAWWICFEHLKIVYNAHLAHTLKQTNTGIENRAHSVEKSFRWL